jgi:predicted MPP superfamily phosphohydrolase
LRVPSRARLVVVAEVVAIGVIGALLGLLVAGRVTAPVGPFDADLSLQPALTGSTTVGIPPLGELRLDTHDGPVQLHVAVTTLRSDAARAIVANPAQLQGLGERVNDDLRDGLVELVVRTVLVTVVGAAALGLLVFRRRLRRVAAATGAGLGALLVAAGISFATFEERALAEPRYTGLLASAPTVVGDVRDLVQRFDAYQLQLGRLVSNVSELYTATNSLPVFAPGGDTVRVLHVSDLHLNPAAFDVIASVIEQFGVDVVVDTGDITDFGSVAEDRYVTGIATLGVPYVYVRGNHDSEATQRAIAALPKTVVLDSTEVVEVAGVRFLGLGDPRFTPDKTTGDDDAPREVVLAVGRTLARSVRTALEPPDIVAVHDPTAAQPLLGETPLVLAGHRHQREDVREDATLLMIQGSTGGAGLRALEGEDPMPITLTVLYLDPETGALQAYDDIRIGGLGANDARISRTVVPPDASGSGPPSDPDAEPTSASSPAR